MLALLGITRRRDGLRADHLKVLARAMMAQVLAFLGITSVY